MNELIPHSAENFVADAINIGLVFLLSFLIGLEREEHKSISTFTFGGVRAFPLIGLMGYALTRLSPDSFVPFSAGFLILGSFLSLAYWKKLSSASEVGLYLN